MLCIHILQSYMTKDRNVSKETPKGIQQDEQLPETSENDEGKACFHIPFSGLIYASYTIVSYGFLSKILKFQVVIAIPFFGL